MRACAIMRCRRSVAKLVNVLYISYAIGVLVLLTCLLLLRVDGEPQLVLPLQIPLT